MPPAAGPGWWRTLSAVDPISLEPLSGLPYPPFNLPADQSHPSENDLFDGHVLALYLVSTGTFIHPISRRTIERTECGALDKYLLDHGMDAVRVEHVCVHCAAGPRVSASLSSAMSRLRAEAAQVLQALFAGEGPRTAARPVVDASPADWAGGLAMLDDDEAPTHAPERMGSGCDGMAGPSEPFPPLPSAADPGPAREREEPGRSSWLVAAGRDLPPLPPPPPPPRRAPSPPPAAIMSSAAEPSASLFRASAAMDEAPGRTKGQRRMAARHRRGGSRRLWLLVLPEPVAAELVLATGFCAARERARLAGVVVAGEGVVGTGGAGDWTAAGPAASAAVGEVQERARGGTSAQGPLQQVSEEAGAETAEGGAREVAASGQVAPSGLAGMAEVAHARGAAATAEAEVAAEAAAEVATEEAGEAEGSSTAVDSDGEGWDDSAEDAAAEARGVRGEGPLVAFRDRAGGHYVLHAAVLGRASPADFARRCKELSSPRHLVWLVVLCRGGHLAAAVFELLSQPPTAPARLEAGARLLAHRTFHRYVTRRGQGGRQSSADGGKSISSAGSSLRRHNEAALVADARAMLAEWAPLTARADAIFTHAPGPANAAALAPLKGDVRVRRVPFTTQRPTLAEVWRVLAMLACVDYVDPEDSACLLAAGAPPAPPRPALEIRWAQAAEDERRQRSEAAEAAAAAAMEAEARALPSELHLASVAGDRAAVAALLEAGADPTIQHIDFDFRTPYDVAAGGGARDAFRRFRGNHPCAWHWGRAHVPSGLTEAEEEARAEREAQRRRERRRAADRTRRARRQGEAAERLQAEAAVEAAAALAIAAKAEAESRIESVEAAEAEVAAAEALEASLEAALAVGCDGARVEAARAQLAALQSPAQIAMRARRRRAAEVSRRLGGLSEAQRAFLLGQRPVPAPPAPAVYAVVGGCGCGEEQGYLGEQACWRCATNEQGAPGGDDASGGRSSAGVACPGDAAEGDSTARAEAASASGSQPEGEASAAKAAETGGAGRSGHGDTSGGEAAQAAAVGDAFFVALSYKGEVGRASVRADDQVDVLFTACSDSFGLPPSQYSLKLILKGKALVPGARVGDALAGCRAPKLLVMSSAIETVRQLHGAAASGAVASFAAEHGSRKARVPAAVGSRMRK